MKPSILEPSDSAAPDEVADEQASDLRQFVTFYTGDEVFAVDMAPVQEIIRAPDLVRVPLAPSTLNGLANLRGRILPILSMRRLFGQADRDQDDSTRVLVVQVGQPLGFVVDRVASVVGVDPRQIEGVGTIDSTVDTNLLSGLIKDVAGHPVVMVLDFAKLVEREYAAIASLARMASATEAIAQNHEAEADEGSDELQLVSFQVAGQEYAITIEDVQEIVQVPETIVHVPRSESHVLGVMTLRNRLLPLVSLRRLYGLEAETLDEKSRLVVLTLGTVSVGLAVDGVSEVLRVPKASVDPMPVLLARKGDLADIAQICRLAHGKRLVSIITARNLFDHEGVQEAVAQAHQLETPDEVASETEEEAMDDDEQVVVFRLGNEEFGVPIAGVQEIVRVPDELIRVPKAPSFVEGVINLRGTVLPVLDLRSRLGLPRIERSDRQRIMVFVIGGVRTGFIVDQVAEVLKLPQASIEAAPPLSTEQSKILSRMANLEKEKRLVQILESSSLVEGKDLDQMAAVTKEFHDQAAHR